MGEGVEALRLLVDGLGGRERVERFQPRLQGGDLSWVRQHGQGLRPVPAGASASGPGDVGRRAVEQPDGVFAVIARIQKKLV